MSSVEQSGHGKVSLPVGASLGNKIIAENLRGVKHRLFVMSGKGGVGKSSVTVNLASALAMRGFKVGILDVDLHGPSIPGLLGVTAPIMADEKGHMLPVVCNENLSFVSMNALLSNKDTAVAWRGPKKTGAIRQFLSEVVWGTLDYLVIDSPPGTGDEHMAVLEAIPDAKCLVVTTPQEVSLADVRKALDFLRTVKASVVGLVENMSGLSCPHCGGQIDLFRRGGGEALARQYQIPFLGAIPIDPAAVVAGDQGIPLVALPGAFPAKKSFIDLADNVANAMA